MLVLLLVSGRAKAADDLEVKVTEKKTITIELNNLTADAVLLFRGSNGEVLFRDSLQLKGDYSRTLDLEVIPNGIYLISLEREDNVLTREVVKSTKGVEITGTPSKIIFKPSFNIMEREVQVFLTNPGKKTSYFDVYDKEGELVTTIINHGSVVQKSLDFSKMPAGEYVIKVRVADYIFIRNFELI